MLDLLMPYVAAGLLGGFGHCSGMCGPLSIWLAGRRTPSVRRTMLLHMGRWLTYGLLGLVAAVAGKAVATFDLISAFKPVYGISLGLIMLYWGLAIVFPKLPRPRKLTDRLSKYVSKGLASTKKVTLEPLRDFAVGMLWGLLPCGFVYAMLVKVLADAPSVAAGSLFMIVFGAATTPALLLITVAGQKLSVSSRTAMNRLAGLLIAGLGAWQIFQVVNMIVQMRAQGHTMPMGG